jgi:hypothetical protein
MKDFITVREQRRTIGLGSGRGPRVGFGGLAETNFEKNDPMSESIGRRWYLVGTPAASHFDLTNM